jgi:hypothetical protein
MLHLDNLFSFSPSGLFYIDLKICHRPGSDPEGVEAKPKKILTVTI